MVPATYVIAGELEVGYTTLSGVLPVNYASGDVSRSIYWSSGSTGDVVWGIKFIGLANDEVLDSALSSQSTVTDTITAAADIMLAQITLSSPALAAGDWIQFELQRVAADGADTSAGDAIFLGLEIQE